MNEKSKFGCSRRRGIGTANWLYYDSQREDEAYLDGNTCLPVVELKSFFDKEKKPRSTRRKKVAALPQLWSASSVIPA